MWGWRCVGGEVWGWRGVAVEGCGGGGVCMWRGVHSCQLSRISLDCPGNCPVPVSRKLTECPGPACQQASFPDTEGREYEPVNVTSYVL